MAAIQMFSRHGFKGSGMREIARLAEVNEITLFRCFRRKKDLFWAATDACLGQLSIAGKLQVMLACDPNPRTTIATIVELFGDAIRTHPQSVRMLFWSGFEMDGEARERLRKHVLPIIEPVNQYLARCKARGEIRNIDPNFAAVNLTASILVAKVLEWIDADDTSRRWSVAEPSACASFWEEALLPNADVLDSPVDFASKTSSGP